MSDKIELLPCPLCGTNAGIFRIKDIDDRDFGGIGVCCETEGCVQIGLRFACGDDPVPQLTEQWNSRVAPAAPVAVGQEPIKLSDDVREFLQEWIDSATGGEDADVDYDFANQLAVLLGPIYTAPPAAEQPDTVKVSRELLEYAARTLERTSNDTLDGRNVANALRALLAEGEA